LKEQDMTDTNDSADIIADDDPDAQYAELTEAAPGDVEYLFAQTASGMGINLDGRITLHNVSASTLWFSDRPYRLTGHTPTVDFVSQWDQGPDNFAENPPNALLSMFDGDTVNDVVIVLSDPKLDGTDLSYAIDLSEGDLTPSGGPVSLFIDTIGRPLTPMSVAGVHRRGRRRGRRRMRRRM
jgi:hypothetical protein